MSDKTDHPGVKEAAPLLASSAAEKKVNSMKVVVAGHTVEMIDDFQGRPALHLDNYNVLFTSRGEVEAVVQQMLFLADLAWPENDYCREND